MIDKNACRRALDKIPNLNKEEVAVFRRMCNDGTSISDLFLEEIPKSGKCTIIDARNYIKEEEEQMSKHLGTEYNMDNVSVAEHVLNEDTAEPEHAHGLYAPVPGDVKFFQEWLEGRHPSLGCMYNVPNQNPPEEYYEQLEEGRRRAYGEPPVIMAAIPIFRR
jgi:hypothetical protein